MCYTIVPITLIAKLCKILNINHGYSPHIVANHNNGYSPHNDTRQLPTEVYVSTTICVSTTFHITIATSTRG